MGKSLANYYTGHFFLFFVMVWEAGSKPAGMGCWYIQNTTINRGAILMKYAPTVDCNHEISTMLQHGGPGTPQRPSQPASADF